MIYNLAPDPSSSSSSSPLPPFTLHRSIGRYDEVFKEADIAFGALSHPACRGSTNTSAGGQGYNTNYNGGKGVCLAANTDCAGHATAPLPLYQGPKVTPPPSLLYTSLTAAPPSLTPALVACSGHRHLLLLLRRPRGRRIRQRLDPRLQGIRRTPNRSRPQPCPAHLAEPCSSRPAPPVPSQVQQLAAGFSSVRLDTSLMVEATAQGGWSVAADRLKALVPQTNLVNFKVRHGGSYLNPPWQCSCLLPSAALPPLYHLCGPNYILPFLRPLSPLTRWGRSPFFCSSRCRWSSPPTSPSTPPPPSPQEPQASCAHKGHAPSSSRHRTQHSQRLNTTV